MRRSPAATAATAAPAAAPTRAAPTAGRPPCSDSRGGGCGEHPLTQPPPASATPRTGDAGSMHESDVEELSAALRDARAKARAARQRGRVLQRGGRMSEAMRAFAAADEHQQLAERLERERALIRRAG